MTMEGNGKQSNEEEDEASKQAKTRDGRDDKVEHVISTFLYSSVNNCATCTCRSSCTIDLKCC